MKIEFTLRGEPRTKKNSQRILRGRSGRPFIAPSPQYKAYEAACLVQIPARARQRIDSPINARYVFYMATRRRVDLTNLLESMDDILVRANVLEDDHSGVIAAHDGCRVRYDRDNPRVEVEIATLRE